MPAERDFHEEIERAAGHAFDLACALRQAGLLALPSPHRHKLDAAIRSAERLQQHLFVLRNDPWSSPSPPKAQQLALM
jgi:hypothetical protein